MVFTMIVAALLGLMFLLVFGGIFLWVDRVGKLGSSLAAELETRKLAARPGRARVVSTSSKNVYAPNGGVSATHIHLTLDIPAEGAVVRGLAIWIVDPTEMHSIRDGSEVDVLIDTQDPRFVFPNVPWARQTGLDPILRSLQP